MKRRTRLLAACMASLMVVTSAAPTAWAAESSPLSEASEADDETDDVTEEDTTDGQNTETENEKNTEITTDYAITVADKPADGTTSGQPFAANTAGSTYFRIPALITTKDGTVVAAADARWKTAADALGIDTMVSRSTDQGETWNYTFANYLGDYGNETDNPNTNKKYAATFIDPELIYDAEDGEKGTLYMLADLYVGGYAINTVPNRPLTGVAFTADGYLKLKKKGETDYNYYLKDGKIYQITQTSEETSEEETETAADTVVADYTVDGKFNLLQGTKIVSNLFFNAESEDQLPEYQAYPTTYLYMTKSTDNGATWSDPQLLNVKKDGEQFYGVGPGRGLRTSDGTLMFSCYVYGGSESSQRSSFIYSTDYGATWKRTEDATSDAWSSESQLVELSDGTIRMFYRNGNNYICYVDASKGTDSEGNVTYTWGTPVKTEVVNWSNCQISAMMYSTKVDGKDAILVSCPTASNRYSGRIFVGLVNDDLTMDWKYTYKGMGSGKYQYSCMTELSDGSIGILYENGDASIAYQKLSIEEIVGEEAVISDFWVADAQGAVVKQVLMKPSETASYTVAGMNSEQVTVTSSDPSVVTVALDDAAAVSGEGTVSFTVTPNRSAAAGKTATITATDGEASYEFEVIITESETKNHEIVQLSVGDSVTYTDETGYYVNVDSGIDQKVASVSMTGEERATYQMAQLKDGTEFTSEYIDLSDCLYTFTKSGTTDGVYTVSGVTADGVTVYLDCAQTNTIPNYSTSSGSTVTVTAAGDANNSFKLKANGKYLHFHKESGGLYFDRCGNDGCDTKHYYELYQKSDSLDGTLKGFTQVTSLEQLTDGGQYLIVSRNTDESLYLLRPYSGTPYTQHVAKVADDASVTRMVQVGSSISNNKAVFAGDSKKLEDCRYTFTSTGTDDQYYLSAVNEDGVTVYFNIESTSSDGGRRPHQTTPSAVTLQAGTTAGTFKLHAEKSGNNPSGAYVHFRTVDNEQLIFDRCGGDNCGANHEFEIYHSSAKAASAISGYEQITSLSDIKDGESYLIVFKVSNNERYVLNPPAGTSDFQSAASYTHVAKLGGYLQIPKAVTEITFTGVRGGDTTAVIGDTTYYIQVENEEKEIQMAVGEKLEISGRAEDDLSDGSVVSAAEKGAYVAVEKPENGGSYVIGNDSAVLTTTTVTTRKGNWGDGFVLSGNVNYEANADTYRNYEWLVTLAGTADETNGTYPCYLSTVKDGNVKYMTFADSKYNNTGNTHVTLETTPQELQISQNGENYKISRQETNISYLTDLANSHERAAGWESGGTDWKFYEREAVTVLTGLEAGTAELTIDHVVYHITVTDTVDKNVSISVGESFDVYGKISEDISALLSVKETGPYVVASELKSGSSYVIGQSNIVLTTTEQVPDVSTWTNGFKLESGADYVQKADTYAGYEWILEILEGADESTKTYPCYLSVVKDGTEKYFAFDTNGTGNNTKISLSAEPQQLQVKQDDNGTYSISIQSDKKVSYLNNFGGQNKHASGWKDYGAGWNFYERDITSTLTGQKIGNIEFTVGNVTYLVTVTDQVDYTRLEMLVNAVSGLETDETFTEESRNGLSAALTAAEQMLEAKDQTEYSDQTALDAAQKTVNDACKAIVKAVMHLRRAVGSWSVTAGENTTGNSTELAGTGLEITKMTISEGMTFDLDASEDAEWSVSEEQWISIGENGTITVKENITGDDILAAFVTAQVDGTSYRIPVILCPDAENGAVFCTHIDEISNSDIYYAWMGEEELIPANEGELICIEAENAEKIGISFVGAPKDGYAMTKMSETGQESSYYRISNGDALDNTESGYLNHAGTEAEAMLTSAKEKGCVGAVGYVKEADSADTVNAGLTFRAEKLPTIQTSVAGIIPTENNKLKESGMRTFVDGMSASEGEYVYFRIRVTTYRPYSEMAKSRAAEDTGLGMTALTLTNAGLPAGSFVDQIGAAIPETPVTSKDITKEISQDDWSSGAESIDHDFYYVYQVPESAQDTVVTNAASMEMAYTGGSKASFTDTASAETALDVDQFPEKDIVIDFGLPVTVHYDSWNKTTNGSPEPVALNTERSGSALYGTVEVSGDKLQGWDVTYTPTSPLLGIDVVRFYGQDGTEYLFKVYPANAVYYEASFIKTADDGKWTYGDPVTDSQETASAEDTQKTENAASNYGYDPAYKPESDTAALSEEEMAVTAKAGEVVTGTAKTTANFTFTGTGVDLYANCTKDTGTAMVMIKQVVDDKTQIKKIIFVDTQLLLGETDKGLKLDRYGEITNVPIVSLKEGSLDYGTYEVTVTHTQKKQVETDEEGNKTSVEVATELRLDGFRVYGTSPDTEVRHVYKADQEYAPVYEVLRDQVLSSLDTKTEAIQADTAEAAAEEVAEHTEEENGTTVGAVIVSSSSYENNQLEDLLKNSSKNELYLYPEQTVTFKLNVSKIQVAMRALGDPVSVTGTKELTVDAQVDMYYCIDGQENDEGYVYTITNGSSAEAAIPSVLSITKIKTVAAEETEVQFLSMAGADLIPAMKALGYTAVDDSEDPKEDPSTGETPVIRISGANRYETSREIADSYKKLQNLESFDTLIVADGRNFPDALSGGYLAVKKEAPILLVKDVQEAEVLAYIRKNLKADGTVYILGGEAAVSKAFQQSLEAFGTYTVKRLGGTDRYETNIFILEEGGITDEPILICTGQDFADGITASASGAPILLVGKNGFTQAQQQFLAEHGENECQIIGGSNAVPEYVETGLKAEGRTVTRLGGTNRYETAAAIADAFYTDPEAILIAYGREFADGLCGGPLAVLMNAPLLLASEGHETQAAAYAEAHQIKQGTVLGGDSRISDALLTQIFSK